MAKIEAGSRHLVQVLMLTGLVNTALCCQCLIKLIPPSTRSFKLRSISAIKTLWRFHCCAGDTKAWVCVAAVLFPQHKRVRPAVSQSLSLPQSQAEKQVPLDSCERASWWPRPPGPGLYIPTLCTNWRLVCLRPSLYRQAHCTHVFTPSHGGNTQKVVKQNFRMEKLCFRGIIWPSGQLFHITCTVLAATYVQHKMGIENWSSDWIPWNSFPSQLMIPHLDSLADVVHAPLFDLEWRVFVTARQKHLKLWLYFTCKDNTFEMCIICKALATWGLYPQHAKTFGSSMLLLCSNVTRLIAFFQMLFICKKWQRC